MIEIKIIGTEEEIKNAKESLDVSCLFNSMYCEEQSCKCDDCERKYLKVTTEVKDQKSGLGNEEMSIYNKNIK